ncbi:FMN-dependent NADH-azoreductase [Conexibacter woesei]|uniref:FMN dependent NADH:quinone oxidoreductase n=1 Tax=Conexibacter woesei (strain DSM 14684 / CCUG 47730 / CIP 108061 / JCM 11494 / NBRC 100937 / ID131577) TaxID=469383 RepID=D3F653_CONWI|nr:NAD(P)H-dependent oxidoreductase [Conexibacter woesei]ADB48726.1 NAD(P)H dehydrogenase (quinone) [Conexibacter woesei DSM 14684]
MTTPERPHLLHIDSSIQGDRSVSRALSAQAAARWRDAHPDGTVVYRDLAAEPLPHIDEHAAQARFVPPEQHTSEQAAAFALSERLAGEVKAADVVLLGLPIYNFGAPSTVKAWVDHLVFPGLSVDGVSGEGLLGGTDLIVLAARGGGYGPGTPKEGWDHAGQWLPHGLSLTGLEPRFVAAELTLADVNPAMAELRGLAAESLAAARTEIEQLWAAERVQAASS